MKKRMLFLILLLIAAQPVCYGQKTFQNLNFESSIPPTDPAGFPDLKGWQIFGSGFGYDTISLGGTSVILHDSDSPYLQPLIGNFSILLVNGFQGNGEVGIAKIAQTGAVPTGTRSVRFVATSLSPVVSFAGNSLAVQQVGSTARYNVFTGDISSFVGQTGELRFSQTRLFDQVTFSPVAVPEPAVVVLIVAGGLLFIFTRRS